MDFFSLLRDREKEKKQREQLKKHLESKEKPHLSSKSQQKSQKHPQSSSSTKNKDKTDSQKPRKTFNLFGRKPSQKVIKDKNDNNVNKDNKNNPEEGNAQQALVDEEGKEIQRKKGRKARVSSAFNQGDEIFTLTMSFDSTFVWCMNNNLLNLIPECAICRIPMKLIKDNTYIHDARSYKCDICSIKETIRFGSFTDEFKCTLMEFSGGIDIAKQMILGIYSFMRELISDRVIRNLKKKKLGGPGAEVWMDSYKLNLKTNSGVEEFWIVGFIEKETNRSRAYLTNDIKIDTIALFIAKTVGKHTSLCTPYYHQVGWEFLDKFFDHQRLKKEKLDLRKGQRAAKVLSGFEKMWQMVKELEIVFMKLGEKARRLKRVKSHLQCYLDEMVWRIECRTLEEKRTYLIKLLCVEEWGKYVKRLQKLQNKKQAQNPKNVAEELMQQIDEEQKKRKKLKRRFDHVQTQSQDEDPMEERRRIFGEESQNSEEGDQSGDSVGNCKDEDEDEFMIVLQAVRERKKHEAESNKALLKDKLSQTGWKLRENFMKKSNAFIDDKDRIDVFLGGGPIIDENQGDESEGDCVILEYNT